MKAKIPTIVDAFANQFEFYREFENPVLNKVMYEPLDIMVSKIATLDDDVILEIVNDIHFIDTLKCTSWNSLFKGSNDHLKEDLELWQGREDPMRCMSVLDPLLRSQSVRQVKFKAFMSGR